MGSHLSFGALQWNPRRSGEGDVSDEANREKKERESKGDVVREEEGERKEREERRGRVRGVDNGWGD